MKTHTRVRGICRESVKCMCIVRASASKCFIWYGNRKGEITILSAESGDVAFTIPHRTEHGVPSSMCFAEWLGEVVVGYGNGLVQVYSVKTYKAVQTFSAHLNTPILSLCVTTRDEPIPSQQRVWTCAKTGHSAQLRLWALPAKTMTSQYQLQLSNPNIPVLLAPVCQDRLLVVASGVEVRLRRFVEDKWVYVAQGVGGSRDETATKLSSPVTIEKPVTALTTSGSMVAFASGTKVFVCKVDEPTERISYVLELSSDSSILVRSLHIEIRPFRQILWAVAKQRSTSIVHFLRWSGKQLCQTERKPGVTQRATQSLVAKSFNEWLVDPTDGNFAEDFSPAKGTLPAYCLQSTDVVEEVDDSLLGYADVQGAPRHQRRLWCSGIHGLWCMRLSGNRYVKRDAVEGSSNLDHGMLETERLPASNHTVLQVNYDGSGNAGEFSMSEGEDDGDGHTEMDFTDFDDDLHDPLHADGSGSEDEYDHDPVEDMSVGDVVDVEECGSPIAKAHAAGGSSDGCHSDGQPSGDDLQSEASLPELHVTLDGVGSWAFLSPQSGPADGRSTGLEQLRRLVELDSSTNDDDDALVPDDSIGTGERAADPYENSSDVFAATRPRLLDGTSSTTDIGPAVAEAGTNTQLSQSSVGVHAHRLPSQSSISVQTRQLHRPLDSMLAGVMNATSNPAHPLKEMQHLSWLGHNDSCDPLKGIAGLSVVVNRANRDFKFVGRHQPLPAVFGSVPLCKGEVKSTTVRQTPSDPNIVRTLQAEVSELSAAKETLSKQFDSERGSYEERERVLAGERDRFKNALHTLVDTLRNSSSEISLSSFREELDPILQPVVDQIVRLVEGDPGKSASPRQQSRLRDVLQSNELMRKVSGDRLGRASLVSLAETLSDLGSSLVADMRVVQSRQQWMRSLMYKIFDLCSDEMLETISELCTAAHDGFDSDGEHTGEEQLKVDHEREATLRRIQEAMRTARHADAERKSLSPRRRKTAAAFRRRVSPSAYESHVLERHERREHVAMTRRTSNR